MVTEVNSRFLRGERKGDGIWKSYGNESHDAESVNYLDDIHRPGGRSKVVHFKLTSHL